MSDDLKMCLSIYSGDGRYFSESEIIPNLPEILELVQSETLRLRVTDGIISIKYHNEELLGAEYWDDVHHILAGVFYSLEDLDKGKEVECYLPMQSMSLGFQLNGDMIIYNLQSSQRRTKEHGEIYIEKQLPKHLFMKEFIHFYFFSARIFATIGVNARIMEDFDMEKEDIDSFVFGHDFKTVLKDWRKLLPKDVLSSAEIDELQSLIEMPLEQWINIRGC